MNLVDRIHDLVGVRILCQDANDRLAKIAAVLKPKKTTYTQVAVLDTPGLMLWLPQGIALEEAPEGCVVVLGDADPWVRAAVLVPPVCVDAQVARQGVEPG